MIEVLGVSSWDSSENNILYTLGTIRKDVELSRDGRVVMSTIDRQHVRDDRDPGPAT
jgi:hypothetical protein